MKFLGAIRLLFAVLLLQGVAATVSAADANPTNPSANSTPRPRFENAVMQIVATSDRPTWGLRWVGPELKNPPKPERINPDAYDVMLQKALAAANAEGWEVVTATKGENPASTQFILRREMAPAR